MYDVQLLQAAFQGLVGLRQPNIPGIPTVQAPLTDSSSGIYADDKNPLIATENLWYSSPNFVYTEYPGWTSGNNYLLGIAVSFSNNLYKALTSISGSVITPFNDVNINAWVSLNPYVPNNLVSFGSTFYKCLNAVTSATSPDLDPTNWSVYTQVWSNYYPFQGLLQQKYNQAVSNLFAEVIRQKKLMHMAKAIIERIQLYRGSGSINNKILSQRRFVGFEIKPQSAEGLWMFIEQIIFQATQSNAAMNFYLYFSDNSPILNQWVLSTTGLLANWIDLKDTSSPPKHNCIMKYLAQNTSGVYYFGYYEVDVIGQALSKDWNCNTQPCQGCNEDDLRLYNQWSRYTTLRSIEVPESALQSDRTLFDTSKVTYGTNTNWGLNFNITVRCDLTDFIINSKYQFADAYAMQLCKEYLEMIAKGWRLGPNPAQTKLSAIADLDRKSPGAWILSYDNAIEALNLDMSGFSSSCMPCEKKNKLKFSLI